MSDRYVLIVARSAAGEAALIDLASPGADWSAITVSARARLFVAPGARLLHWPGGALVGTLFARGGRAPLDALGPAAIALVGPSGAGLVDRHWGAYVACLADAESKVSVVRAPFGDLPCLWHNGDDLVLAASDIDLLAHFGVPTVPDPARVAAYLGYPDYLGSATCLAGIDEVRGGDVLHVPWHDAPSTKSLWSPWKFASDERIRLYDPCDAASRVGDAVRLSVAARTALHPQAVLLLSGGIDSSVVAASLAAAGRSFTCLNFMSANAGDEERYAQLVAEACGAPLEIGVREAMGVDLLRSAAAGLPRPSARSFMQESARLANTAAARHGATTIVDGGGGDSIFNAYLSVAPLAELWQRDGWSRTFGAKVTAMAELGGVSRWRVAMRGIARAYRSSRAHRPPLLDYLSGAARDAIAGVAAHPWLTVPPGIGLGTASYVAGLPPVQGLVEGQDPHDGVRSIAPLITQPVIEACLRVPSWMWFEPWNSRIVVREAFAGALPPAIIERRSKGTPESFVAGIFEARREQIGRMLLDGRLAAMGLIDHPALAAALSANAMTRGYAFNRILRLVDAEAWARSWSGGRRV